MKKILLFLLFAAPFLATAQTYTFECVSGARLTGDSCDLCPSTIIQSRSFNGLVIYRAGEFYRWVDQPYSIRVKPGNIIEYWEHGANPYSERITIPLSETPFYTVQGMADSTWCNFTAPLRFAELNLDSISTTTAKAWLSGSNTGFGLREGTGVTFSYDADTLIISAIGGTGTVTSVAATAPASGFTISGSPITTSGTFLFTLANDLAALEGLSGTGIPARTGTDTWALRSITAGTGISVANGNGVSGNPTITNSAPDQTVSIAGAGISVVTGTYPAFTVTSTEVDGSTTNEVQTYSHSGTTTYTNTLSLGGGSWSITGAGIAAISNTAGAITVTATEAQVANNGLSDNEAGGGIFRLGNRYMNSSDGLFSNDRKVNLNAFKLYIGDNTDSTLVMFDGTNDRVGIHTTIADTKLHVNGNMKVTDLSSVTPTRLVGADGNGIFAELFLGSGLSISAGTLNVSAAGFYQTFRDDGVAATQRPNANFVSTGRISTLLTDDAGNTETEASFDIVTNSIGNTQLRQGVARSVVGVTGNATANVADIQGTTDQVLRVSTAGTALAFGQIATGGITDDAVTYAKIQNVVSNNVVLGNIAGAGGIIAELTQANLYTLLGMTGVANRFALWTGTNTLSSDAAFTFDGTNDRMTVNGTVAGSGANAAFLNLNSGAITGATEFLRMSGNITGNMVASLLNSNNLANSNSILTVSVGGSVAGDPLAQFTISGVVTNTIGTDNSDNDKFKITTNSSTPGGNGNASFVMTKDAIPLYGFNTDAPVYVVDIAGQARATQFKNTSSPPTVDTPGAGLGTGGTIDIVEGGNNGFSIQFTTGTTPTADGNLFKVTYSTAFTTNSFPIWCAGNGVSATDYNKFSRTTQGPAGFTQQAKGTLTANTTYKLFYNVIGL
jgi:hypothetical protein